MLDYYSAFQSRVINISNNKKEINADVCLLHSNASDECKQAEELWSCLFVSWKQDSKSEHCEHFFF